MTPQERRTERELQTVETMIGMYCQAQHDAPGEGLCPACEALLAYARRRVARCPWEVKPTCAKCPVHCYDACHREEMRRVMRYAGPRMVFRHPVMALMHGLDGRRREPLARKVRARGVA